MASPKGQSMGFVINLRKILEEYAWQRYLKKLGFPMKFLARKDKFYFDMRWSYLNFEHDTKWTSWHASDNANAAIKPPTKLSDITNTTQSETATPKTSGHPIVLHSADYENRTPSEQKYTFSTQRETSASVSVEFQENYTLGGETNIELSLPGDVVSVSAGVSGELSVTETEGQSYSETHTWSVDTEIAVEAGHKAKAFLAVHETEITAEFEVLTVMSLGKEWFPIMVRKRENDEIVHTLFITSLKEVYGSHEGANLKVMETTDDENRVSYKVQLSSRGRFKSIGWTEQEVIVHSELMSDLSPQLKESIDKRQERLARGQ